MILTIQEAKKWAQLHQKTGKNVVFTNGCFDILHAGHVTYLQQAKALGDVLLVGINSDASVARLKGSKRPIVPQAERVLILDGLKAVDGVVIFEEDTPLRLIDCVRPDIHVKGGDYTVTALPEYPLVTGYGGKVMILPFVDGCSTTKIVQTVIARFCLNN